MDADSHALLVEARAQLQGIRGLSVGASDSPLVFLTGFELNMLLKPVAERLDIALRSLDN